MREMVLCTAFLVYCEHGLEYSRFPANLRARNYLLLLCNALLFPAAPGAAERKQKEELLGALFERVSLK